MSEYLYQGDNPRSQGILRRALGTVASFFGQTAETPRHPAHVFGAESRKVSELQTLLDIVAAEYKDQQRAIGESTPSDRLKRLSITSSKHTIRHTFSELVLERALIAGDCAMYLSRRSPELPNSCETVNGLVDAPAKRVLLGVKATYGLRSQFGMSAKEGVNAAQEALKLRFYGAHLLREDHQKN